MTDVDFTTKFSERQAHWTSVGFTGRGVFDQLAIDILLPSMLQESDVAAITGLSKHAIKQRRARGMEPAFIRVSSRCVRYPREAICSWLANLYEPSGSGAVQ